MNHGPRGQFMHHHDPFEVRSAGARRGVARASSRRRCLTLRDVNGAPVRVRHPFIASGTRPDPSRARGGRGAIRLTNRTSGSTRARISDQSRDAFFINAAGTVFMKLVELRECWIRCLEFEKRHQLRPKPSVFVALQDRALRIRRERSG